MNCKVLKYVLVAGLSAMTGLWTLQGQTAVDFAVFSSAGGTDTVLMGGESVFCDWNMGEPITETFGSYPGFDASKKRLTQGFEQGEGFIEDPFAEEWGNVGNGDPERIGSGLVRVYPNPVRYTLNVVLSDETELNYTLSLRALQGGHLAVRQQAKAGSYTMDMSRFPSGVYLLEVIAGTERGVFKVVKVQ